MSAGGREAAKAASSEAVEITDQVADGVWARVTEWRRDPAQLLFAPDGTLSRGLVFGVAALFTLPTVDYFWRYEGGAANLPSDGGRFLEVRGRGRQPVFCFV